MSHRDTAAEYYEDSDTSLTDDPPPPYPGPPIDSSVVMRPNYPAEYQQVYNNYEKGVENSSGGYYFTPPLPGQNDASSPPAYNAAFPAVGTQYVYGRYSFPPAPGPGGAATLTEGGGGGGEGAGYMARQGPVVATPPAGTIVVTTQPMAAGDSVLRPMEGGQRKPPSYLILSIVTCICFSPLLGCIAVSLSSKYL